MQAEVLKLKSARKWLHFLENWNCFNDTEVYKSVLWKTLQINQCDTDIQLPERIKNEL
jgi:hypothetical protein